jgi:hypothetical protein
MLELASTLVIFCALKEPTEDNTWFFGRENIMNWSLANFIATTGRDQCYTNVPYTSEIKKRQSPIMKIVFRIIRLLLFAKTITKPSEPSFHPR